MLGQSFYSDIGQRRSITSVSWMDTPRPTMCFIYIMFFINAGNCPEVPASNKRRKKNSHLIVYIDKKSYLHLQ